MLKKLKYKFKNLPICILGDSLYAFKSLYDICKEYNWKFIFRFKEGRTKSLWNEFVELKNIESFKIITQDSSKTDIHEYVNEVYYHDIFVNLIETEEIKVKEHKDFVFVTNIEITNKNATDISNAGR